MKKLIYIAIFLLCNAKLFSQIMQTNGTPGGYSWVAGKFADLRIPYGADTPNVTQTRFGQPTQGSLFMKTGDSSVWIRSAYKWNQITGGGGSSDTTNLSYRIDTLSASAVVRLYYRGGPVADSFYYEKDGTEVFWYANPAEDRVISWSATWTGVGLDYSVTAYYRLGGNYYTISNEIVTLPPLSNPALSRRDLFIVDTSPAASSITGTEAVNPVPPSLTTPFTQLALTDILLNPGQTTGVTDTLIVYDQLASGEFENRGNPGTTATFNNTTNVYRVPYSANIGSLTNNDVIGFGTETPRDISSKLTLSFAIQLKAIMPNNKGMLVSLWNNGVQIGNEAGIPLNRTDLNYQLFSIPLSLFSLTSTTVDSVSFRFSGGGAAYAGIYMDWIYFQGNFNGGSGAYSGPWVTAGVGISVDSSIARKYEVSADTTLLATHHYVDSSISASGGGNTKYVLGEYGLVNDSATTNVYKLRVDSSVIASHTYVQNWLANYTALNGTGYVKMSGTTPAYRSNAQLTSDVNTFTQTLSGAVPQPTTLNGYFLKDDGTWAKAIVPADTAAMNANNIRRIIAGTNVTVDNSNPQYPIVSASGGSAGWSLSGNSINAATDRLGTTNNTSIRFITNNTNVGVLDSMGNFGLGITVPLARYHIVDNATNTGLFLDHHSNDITTSGTVYRKSRGTQASPLSISRGDYSGGTVSYNYTGSTYLHNMVFGGHIGGAVSATSAPTDFYIGMDSAGFTSDHPFFENSVKFIVKYTGKVGINDTLPSEFLTVRGKVKIDTLLTAGNTDSTVTVSNGVLGKAARLSVTTTGSTGAATLNNTTGVLNIPIYSGSTVSGSAASGQTAVWTSSTSLTGKNASDPFYTPTVATKAVTTWTVSPTAPDALIYVDNCWSAELGLFAAPAQNGAFVKTSPDGINWTLRAAPSNANWHGIVYAPELGLFVCVGGGSTSAVMTSPDGVTWTARTTPNTNNWDGLVWSPQLSLLVAVGYSGTGNRVMTSPDGINWTARTSAADNDWAGVEWSPELSLFVAVANSGTGNRVMTSTNGTTWTIGSIGTDRNWDGVKWSASLGLFVAISYSSGVSNNAMTSPDGITWTLRTTPTNITYTRLAYSPELQMFAATGSPTPSATNLATSPDGITWTSRTTTNANWGGIAWSPELGIFSAVSWGGASMISEQPYQKNYIPTRLLTAPFTILNAGATVNSIPNVTALVTNAGVARLMLNNTNTSGSRNMSFEMSSNTAKYAFGTDFNANGGDNFWLYNRTSSVAPLFINSSSNIGVNNNTSPTAKIHIGSGTASANTAPLKFTTGTPMTTPEAGAVEYNGTNFFVTPSTVRYDMFMGLSGSATLDFGSIASLGNEEKTITVTGAADGDVVSVGVLNAAFTAGLIFTGRVSATNTVSVQCYNSTAGAIDPASAVLKVKVFKN